jgi:hypothetical protein
MTHISEIIEDILVEWAYRVHDGMPNPKNAHHIQELRESMEELNLPNKVIYEVIQNLINEDGGLDDKEKEKAKKMGLVHLGKGAYGKEGGESSHQAVDGKLVAKGDKEEPEKETKPPMKIDANPFDDKEKDKDGEEKTKDDKQKSKVGSSEQQQQKTKIDKEVKEDLDFIVKNADDVRTQGGAGSNTPTRQQVQDLQTFTEKRMEQDSRRKAAEEKGEEFNEEPYVHPNVTQREINDETLDKSIDYLKEQLGEEEFENLIRFLAKGGGVHPHLTKVTKLKRGEPGLDPESPGYKRVRELIRLYLKNDGKCVVTGVPMKLSICEPDHRIPYSSAKDEAERNGTTVQEEQQKLDDFTSNLDLMVGPVNQFKSSLIDDKLLNATRKRLAMSEEAEEVKKLEKVYKNERAKALNKHYREKYLLGDFTSLTEKRISEADDDERNAMMKAWNYLHPNKKEMREQIEGNPKKGKDGNPNYYEELKKAWKAQGIELPDNPDDIDWNNPPFDKWMNRYGFGGGDGRPRSNRLSAGPERKYMKEHFTKSGQNVPTIEEQSEVDETIDEARQKIRKDSAKKQIDIQKIKLRDPNLSDKQKQNVQKKIDNLQKSLE